MPFDLEKIWETLICLLLAVAGGLTRLLSRKGTKGLVLSRLFAEVFISAFSGLMIVLLARALGLSGDWLGLVAGIAGWIGPRMLDKIAEGPVGKALGLQLKSRKEK
jgi:hypothetical protein